MLPENQKVGESYVHKCHGLLEAVYQNSAKGADLYKLFHKIIKSFLVVSPQLRTELFLQLIIYASHTMRFAD